MSNAHLTHVTIVLDRSGSMASIRDDAIGGFNTCIDQQKRLAGAATLTLVQFDHEYCEVYRAMPLQAVPVMTVDTFVPRGQTALYDAIGRAVVETAEYVRGLPEEARPGKVVVVILTDGHENASCEYPHARVQTIIQERTAAGWDFLFLGANMDAVAIGRAIGFSENHTASFVASARGTRAAFDEMSDHITASRLPPDPKKSKSKLH
jgi:hypothetical protein